MIDKKEITGIILAGGKSLRMGTDKAFLTLDNTLFIQHIIDALTPLVQKIIIVSDNPKLDVLHQQRFEDLMKNAGPLAGLYTGLHHSTTNFNLVLSCDIPLITTEVLEKLITQTNPKYDVVQLKTENQTMPLIAMYKKHCSTKLAELLEKKERKMKFALKHFKTQTVQLDKTMARFTANINTPEDLKTNLNLRKTN